MEANNENPVLGYAKTSFGTFQVIADNASDIIEKRICEAVNYLKDKGINASSEVGCSKGVYHYNGHNMLNKSRKNEPDKIHFHTYDPEMYITVTFHKNKIEMVRQNEREFHGWDKVVAIPVK